MKKLMLIYLVGLTIFAALTGCAAVPLTSGEATASDILDPSGSTQAVPEIPNSVETPPVAGGITSATSDIITEEQAKVTALEHAGLTEVEVTFVSVHLDYDDGRKVYEVEFYSGNTEYDYDIDATTGAVLGYDTDIENYIIGQGQRAGVNINEATAKTIALEKVTGATDADIRIYLDYDDGRPVYEGSIVYNEMKYEFEISAADGTVIEWEMESIYD